MSVRFSLNSKFKTFGRFLYDYLFCTSFCIGGCKEPRTRSTLLKEVNAQLPVTAIESQSRSNQWFTLNMFKIWQLFTSRDDSDHEFELQLQEFGKISSFCRLSWRDEHTLFQFTVAQRWLVTHIGGNSVWYQWKVTYFLLLWHCMYWMYSL